MADPRLEQIRAKMREEEEKKNGGNRTSGSGGDNASYPYWNIPENATAIVRFLPDKDENNPWLFFVERQTIRLPFKGVVGGEFPTDKWVQVTVPCADMFEKDACPIIAETRPWWREEGKKKELARKYYKKRSNITQGFIVSSPFEEKDTPENPIRRLMVGPELLAKLKAGMADPDMEYMPTDYINGCDFRIRKTIKGEYNNYGTSEWARRSRPLSEEEQIALDRYGLFDLKEFLGPRPDADQLLAIKAMFHASLAEDAFDMEAFGKYPWKPYGGGAGNSTSSASTPTADDEMDDLSTTTVNTGAQYARGSAEGSSTASVVSTQTPDLIAKLRAKASNRAA